MSDLGRNQMLITLSEDGKKTTVEIGGLHEVTYSSCPDKPYEQLQNSINDYVKSFGLDGNRPGYEAWSSKGCWYKDTGNCNDCN